MKEKSGESEDIEQVTRNEDNRERGRRKQERKL